VPGAPFDSQLLLRTALCTSLALALAAGAGAILVMRAAGSFAPGKTLLRTGLAMAAAIGVGSLLPWLGRAFLAVEVVLVVGTYLAVAIVTGELTRDDLRTIKAIVARKRPATK
jgi:hypothetical protein